MKFLATPMVGVSSPIAVNSEEGIWPILRKKCFFLILSAFHLSFFIKLRNIFCQKWGKLRKTIA